MPEEETRTRTYNAEQLLANAVKEFPDDFIGDTEGREAFAASFDAKRGLRSSPIVVAQVDGQWLLIDGRKRLEIMWRSGTPKKPYVLEDDEVVVAEHVHTVKQALIECYTRNVNRRHLSMAERGVIARKLQVDHHLTQVQIAKICGVSQPAVSKWLAIPEQRKPAEPPPSEGEAAPKTTVPAQGKSPEEKPGDLPDVGEQISDEEIQDAAKVIVVSARLKALQEVAWFADMAVSGIANHRMGVDADTSSDNMEDWTVTAVTDVDQAERMRGNLRQTADGYGALADMITAGLAAREAEDDALKARTAADSDTTE